MWRAIQVQTGWRCENTKSWDRTDQIWSTEEEASQWAEQTNAAQAAWIEANKRLAAERKAARKKVGPMADSFYIDNHSE